MNVNTYINEHRLPSGNSLKVSEKIDNLDKGRLVDDEGTYWDQKRPVCKQIAQVFLYFLVGGLFFTNVEEKDCANQPNMVTLEESGFTYVELEEGGDAVMLNGPWCTQAWTGLDAMYYSVVTVTTVGYGDFAPTTDEGRIFGIFFILIGLGVVFNALSSFADYLIQNLQNKALEKMDDDPDDNEAPHGAKMFISALSIVICVLLGTWFFNWAEPFSFSEALWWSFVTTTTVGYGDLSLENESSKIFSIFFILISVMIVATAIGNFSAIQQEIAYEKKRNALLDMELNETMILSLDKSGEGELDKEEFVTGMLCLLELVKEEDVEPWRQRFDVLDVDGSGELDHEDLKRIAKEEAEKAAIKKDDLESRKLTTWEWIKNSVSGEPTAKNEEETRLPATPKPNVEDDVRKTLQRDHSVSLASIVSDNGTASKYLPQWLIPYTGILIRVAFVIMYFVFGVIIFTSLEERECDDQPDIKVFVFSGRSYYQLDDSGEYVLDGMLCITSWTIVDALYYSVVTVTTVGYGDFAPETVAGRYIGIMYILIGLAVIFKFINDFATYIIDLAQEHALNKLDDDPDDGKAPHGAKIAISIIAILVMILVGTAFYDSNEDFTFLEGFWWSFVTTTTVGYGDLSLTKESSRLFSIFYILFSVMVVAASIGNFAVVQSEIKAEKNKERLLEKSLDENLILNLDADGGGSIDKEEFVTGMLLLLELVSEADVQLWRLRFDELDVDGSGNLDAEDLKKLAEMEAEKKEKRKAKLDEKVVENPKTLYERYFAKAKIPESESQDTSLVRQASALSNIENPGVLNNGSLSEL